MEHQQEVLDSAGPRARISSAADLNSAPMATLASTCASRQAHALSDQVVSLILAHEDRAGSRRRARRAADLESLKRTVGALLADLLSRPAKEGWGALAFRSLNANAFSQTATPYRQFMAALKALTDLALIERTPGFYEARKFDFGSGSYGGRGKASRFRATPKLLAIAAEHHITAGAVREHFHQPLPIDVLILKGKATRVGRRKAPGQKLDIPDCGIVRTLSDQVRAINTFLQGVTITGGNHNGFIRSFEHGDQPGFHWNKGGRLYSSGKDSYQSLGQAARLAMQLNGRSVAELDLKASYLTILHGKLGMHADFGDDPYAVAGLPRSVVKSWLVAAFGAEKHPQRWPAEAAKAYAKLYGGNLGRDYAVKDVGERLLSKYPALQHIGQPGLGWADLMFTESEVIIGTMIKLVEQGIPSLPVHDSLLVPTSLSDQAAEIMTNQFKALVGCTPLIKVERGTCHQQAS